MEKRKDNQSMNFNKLIFCQYQFSSFYFKEKKDLIRSLEANFLKLNMGLFICAKTKQLRIMTSTTVRTLRIANYATPTIVLFIVGMTLRIATTNDPANRDECHGIFRNC